MWNRGLYQFVVRGLSKVRSVVLLHALVHNLQTTIRLCREKKLAQSWTGILRAGLSRKSGEEQRVVVSG